MFTRYNGRRGAWLTGTADLGWGPPLMSVRDGELEGELKGGGDGAGAAEVGGVAADVG